jgi:ABC-type branched-subunit amino acid transport system substrate-binding protein
MKPRVLFLILALVVVAALATAPSFASRSSSAASVRTYVPATSKKLTLPLVKIGTIVTLGSSFASDQSSVAAAIIGAARSINRSGGLHGHPLGVTICNNKSDPNESVTCARNLISSGIVALVGGQVTFDALTQPLFEAAGIPMIAIYPISPQANNGKNVYLPNLAPTIGYEIDQAYAVYKKQTPIAAFTNDSSASKLFADVIEAQLKQVWNMSYAKNVLVPTVVGDFTPLAAAVNTVAPKAVISYAGSTNFMNMMKAVNSTGTSVQNFYHVWAYTAKGLYAGAGAAATEKLILAGAYPTFDDPRMAAFVKDMNAEKARGDIHADISDFDARAVDGWVGLRVLFAITKGMKDITPANLMTALNSAHNLNVGPFLPPWTPTAAGPPNLSRLSNQTGFLSTFRNGKQVLLLKSPINLSDALQGKFPAK